MALRKVLDKFRTRSSSKNGSSETDNGSNTSKGDGEANKKMKKVRSIRIAPKKMGYLPSSKPVQPEPPHYMKPTSSYDTRKEKNQVTTNSSTSAIKTKSTKISISARALVKNSSLRIARASMKKMTGKSQQLKQGSKTTSSSTTDSKPHSSTDHDKCGGASAVVCPYSYCSLHGHGHGHGAMPSLKRFLSLKVQKSMNLRGYSSIEKKGGKEMELVEDVVNELFNEIHTKLQAQSQQQEWDEQEGKEDIQIDDVINRINKTKLEEDQSDAGQMQESCSVTSIEDCGDKNSELSMEEIKIINQFLEYIEKECQENAQIPAGVSDQAETEATSSESHNDGRSSQNTTFSNGFEHPRLESACGEGQKDMGDNLSSFPQENHCEQEAVHAQLLNNDRDEDNFDGFQSQVIKVKDSASMVTEQPFIELNSRSKVKRRWRRQSSKKRESIKEFNPRPPRLLELQAKPEAEQVNLKHQSVEERKAAEEWMVDFALRKALRRLTSVRKKKVPELVAAFETVLPQKV